MNTVFNFFYGGLSATLTLLLSLTTACSDPTAPGLPDTIPINRPALYPESMTYDAVGKRFIVSSLTAGAIGQVTADGIYTLLADDEQLVSTTGLFVDAPRNRVLTAIGDLGGNPKRTSAATQYKLAAVASYDRSTGKRLSYVNLSQLRPGASHFANDIAVDRQGNVYVTDSFAPIIYKIDPQGTASVFLEDSRLAAPAGSFGLNGLVFHPDGYLLVAKYDEGTLYKIPLSDPKSFALVASDSRFVSADGLLLADNNTLLIAANGQTNRVFRVRTTDGWARAQASGSSATGDVFPTALAQVDSDVYVLQSYVSALLSGQNPPVAQFGIKKIAFE